MVLVCWNKHAVVCSCRPEKKIRPCPAEGSAINLHLQGSGAWRKHRAGQGLKSLYYRDGLAHLRKSTVTCGSVAVVTARCKGTRLLRLSLNASYLVLLRCRSCSVLKSQSKRRGLETIDRAVLYLAQLTERSV